MNSVSHANHLLYKQVLREISFNPDRPDKLRLLPSIWRDLNADKPRETAHTYEQRVFH